MPNKLLSATTTPGTIKSGSATNVDVTYRSDDDGTISFSATGYQVSPASVDVPASQAGAQSTKVTITGAKGTCQLDVQFFASRRTPAVQIT